MGRSGSAKKTLRGGGRGKRVPTIHAPEQPTGSASATTSKSKAIDKNERTSKGSGPLALACPFRKHDPRHFNVRDHPECSEPFLHSLLLHILLSHSDWVIPKDRKGITDVDSNLRLQDIDLHTLEGWSQGYALIFPDDTEIPSPHYDEILELFDHHAIQLQCLQTFVDNINVSISPKILASRPSEALMDILRQFVDVTFNFSRRYGLDLLAKEPHTAEAKMIRTFDQFIKSEETQERKAHGGSIKSIALSHDSAVVASASHDPTVRIWQANAGECMRELKGHSDSVRSIAFSHDSALIASGSLDSTVRIWHVDTGECLRELRGHSDNVRSVAFSHDSVLVASGSWDGTARIWRADTGESVLELKGHSSGVSSVAFSHDSALVASGSWDGKVRIWHANTGDCMRELKGHSNGVSSIAFSHDSALVVSGSRDDTVRIWHADTGECMRELNGHTDDVSSVAFSHDSALIASGSWDYTVRIWHTDTGECLQALDSHGRGVTSVAFSHDSALVASGLWDSTVRIWHTDTGECIQQLHGHRDGVNSAAFSHDSALVASASVDGTIRIWGKEENSEFDLKSSGFRKQLKRVGGGKAIESAEADQSTEDGVLEYKLERPFVKEESTSLDGMALACSADGVRPAKRGQTGLQIQGLGVGGNRVEISFKDDPDGSPDRDSDTDTQDSSQVTESQLRDILNYSCHNILHADVDSIADSRLLYDTLIDIVNDFVIDLTEASETYRSAAQSQGNEGNSVGASFAAGSHTGSGAFGHPSYPRSDGNEADDGNEQLPGGGNGNAPGQPFPDANIRGRGLRLPCPLRMEYPHIFNVRTHYTCSMTYFRTIGRLKEHLREYHKRPDGAKVLCQRCFVGFGSQDELRQHLQADILCDKGEFDPTIGLHEEAIKLLGSRKDVGQDYLTQWRDICNIVFQTKDILPLPEYRAVVEHFEFLEAFISELSTVAGFDFGSVYSHCPRPEYLASSFRRWFRLGMDGQTPSLPYETAGGHDLTGIWSSGLSLEEILKYCNKLVLDFSRRSRDIHYENDGSRGNGGKRPRRHIPPSGRFITPTSSHHSFGSTNLPNQPNPPNQTIQPVIEGGDERATKRRRLAAAASAASAAGPSALTSQSVPLSFTHSSMQLPASHPDPPAFLVEIGWEGALESTQAFADQQFWSEPGLG